jgi:hypothetical protein
LGGPSIATVAKKAALALKLARAADKRSKNALAVAKRAGGTSPAGTNGTSGSSGTAGSTGPAGPPGPAGSSGAQKIDFRAQAVTGDTKILDFGGLVLTARCDAAAPFLSVSASSTVANSEFHVSGVTGKGTPPVGNPVYLDSDHLGPGSTPVSLPTSNFQGSFTYSTPAGLVVTGTVAGEQTAFSGATACWFGGWAQHDPA